MIAHPSSDDRKIGELLATFRGAQSSPIESFRQAIQAEQKSQQNRLGSALEDIQRSHQSQFRSAVQSVQNSHDSQIESALTTIQKSRRNQIKSVLQAIQESHQSRFRSTLKAIDSPEFHADLFATQTSTSRILSQYHDFLSIIPETVASSTSTQSTAIPTGTSGYPSTEYPEFPTEPSWLSKRITTIVYQITFLVFQHTVGLKRKMAAAKDRTAEILDDEQIRTQIALGILLLDTADKTVTQVPPEMNFFMFLYGFLQYLSDCLNSNK